MPTSHLDVFVHVSAWLELLNWLLILKKEHLRLIQSHTIVGHVNQKNHLSLNKSLNTDPLRFWGNGWWTVLTFKIFVYEKICSWLAETKMVPRIRVRAEKPIQAKVKCKVTRLIFFFIRVHAPPVLDTYPVLTRPISRLPPPSGSAWGNNPELNQRLQVPPCVEEQSQDSLLPHTLGCII